MNAQGTEAALGPRLHVILVADPSQATTPTPATNAASVNALQAALTLQGWEVHRSPPETPTHTPSADLIIGVTDGHDPGRIADTSIALARRHQTPVAGWPRHLVHSVFKGTSPDGREPDRVEPPEHCPPSEAAARLAAAVWKRKALIAEVAARQTREVASENRSTDGLGAIAGSVAHDLSNSFGPILMAVDLLRMQRLDGPVAELLEMIDTSARDGTAIVSQLSAFSKGAQGERVPIHVGHLVREALKQIRSSYPKAIQIQSSVEREPRMILGDVSQLRQLLLCLSANARDAMPHGGTLGIHLRNVELGIDFTNLPAEMKPGPYLLLEIIDTGDGTTPVALDANGSNPSNDPGPNPAGFKFGLAAALGIVRSHGGTLRHAARPGAGSVFQVYLPALPPSSEPSSLPPATDRVDARGMTVLVADDEPAGRRLLTTMLEKRGFKVLAAGDGTEALALLALHRSEIQGLFTDLMMPHLDGFQLTMAARRMLPALKVVVISGLPRALWRLGGDALNVLSVLPKPFRPDQLDEVLRTNFASQE